jgi:predicted ATPase/DNA-binding CsgD family transcriptional regulator
VASGYAAESAEGRELTVGNLQPQLTRLIGREAALRELSSRLWHTRLLTLCGPGGVGKTRLAVAVAEAVQADFIGGAWWVDLSATMDSELVGPAVVRAVLPGEQASEVPSATIARQLGDTSLLVLDNCEQVIEGCAEFVRALLARNQAVRVIATSRQPLGVPGEQVWRVQGLAVSSPAAAPLAVPEPGEEGSAELFVERVREISAGFDPDGPGCREAIARVCSQLDGLPLALELAAARVPLLGVEQIAGRLEHGHEFLRHASRTVPERQRTLAQTLEWSHRLLAPVEQTLFRRLAVFRGSFSLAAAERVCADASLSDVDVLDALGALVHQSLVQVLEDQAGPRYRLPSTLRSYAAAKLADSGERAATHRRHAETYTELAEQAEVTSAGMEQIRWLERLELEHDNFREALDWLAQSSPAEAARLASLLWPFWYQHGYYREARTWFERVLAVESELDEPELTQTLLRAGEVAFLQCDYDLAIDRLDRVLALTGDKTQMRTRALVLQRLGSIAREQGHYEQAKDFHEQSLALWEALQDAHGVACARNYLGFVAWLRGDCAAAELLCTLALQEFRRTGSLENVAGTLINLGAAALYSANNDRATTRLEEALAISRRLGFPEGVAWSSHELAIVGRRERRSESESAQMLRDALLVHHQLGDRWRLASVLEELAGTLLVRRDAVQAAALLSCVARVRGQIGVPVPPAELPDREAAMARAQRKLGQRAFAAATTEGAAWTLDRAVDTALEAIEELLSERGPGERQSTPILTSRELAVLELVVRGLTNREIAAELYISPSTAGVHVSNILRKLGAKRRVDAAGLAHTLGLLAVS